MGPIEIALLIVGVLGLGCIGGLLYYITKMEKEKEDPPIVKTRGVEQMRKRGKGKRRAMVQEEAPLMPIKNDKEVKEPTTKKEIAKALKKQEKEEMKKFRERQLQDKRDRDKVLEEKYKSRKAEERKEEALAVKREKKLKEEKVKQEKKEFDAWKGRFEVQASGANEEASEQDIEAFITYLEERKVVVMEDVAAAFGLKTQQAVDRVESLLNMERLTGILDDRGKFISITKQEMKGVIEYIQQKGRISMQDLSNHSSQLIELNPKAPKNRMQQVESEEDTQNDSIETIATGKH